MKLTAWSPSRLASYEECPKKCRLEQDKLCPKCFKGKLSGGFDKPPVCDTCKQTILAGPALERGSKIGAHLDRYLKGEEKKMPTEITNQEVHTIATRMKQNVKAGLAQSELELAFDKGWRRVPWFSSEAWLRAKLDLLFKKSVKLWQVIDWKTGGIDKRSGEIRALGKYADQLSIYTVAALTLASQEKTPNPKMKAEAALVFVDAGGDPVLFKEEADLTMKGLPAAQARWEERVLPMLSDDEFAPKPSADSCRFCPFKKASNGPCPY